MRSNPDAGEGRPFRIDLHCHTSRFSACSSLDPDALVRAAAAAGLDAVCLTEHDRLWPQEELNALAERHGIAVLGGAEVTTELGHVLVYGVEHLPPALFVAATLIESVRAQGGVAVLAHPTRAGQPHVRREALRRLFDTVEVLNGSDGPEQNRAAAGMAHGLALPGVAGSDCHSPAEVGTVATVLPCPVAGARGLVDALRLGRHCTERRG